MISDGTRAAIDAAISEVPQRRGALLAALHLVQGEHGFVSREAADELAEILDIRVGDVLEVVSFYNMFYDHPQPRHHIGVCTNLPCSLRGGRGLLRALAEHCGVGVGEATPDGRLVVFGEECLGGCAYAPVVRVDDVYHETLDLDAARHLLDGLA